MSDRKDAESYIQELDALHNEKRFEEVHRLSTRAVSVHPTNVEIKWRHARSFYDLANGSCRWNDTPASRLCSCLFQSPRLSSTCLQSLLLVAFHLLTSCLERMDDPEYRKRMLKRGLDEAKESVELESNHFATHKWFAIFTSAYVRFASRIACAIAC